MRPIAVVFTVLIFATIINSSSANDGKVYVVLFMHNEDTIYENLDEPEAKTKYLKHRQMLIEMAEYLNANSVHFAWQSDWKFLEGILKYETPELQSLTNGKNLVKWLKEDMGISVDAHSHENYGYNYADVACLIDSLGVSPPNIIGGHIWDPYSANYAFWERFRQPLQGSKYPHYSWNGRVLIGSGTPAHTNDPQPSGIWHPTDKYNYWTDDPQGEVLCVGQYTGDIQGVEELVNLYRTGMVPEDSILTCTIHTPQGFNMDFMDDFRQDLIEPLLDMQQNGDIQIVDFEGLIRIWETEFSGKTHLYNIPEPNLPDQFGIRLPSAVAGVSGIYIKLTMPQTSRYENNTTPVVVHVAGGWNGLGVTNKSHRLAAQGFIGLDFNFPGSGLNVERSGGIYDERGEKCIRALADVVKFAMGKKEDIDGYRISDMIGKFRNDDSNTGMCGWSNGGNATITAAGKHGDELSGLAWIVNFESPVGDGMTNVDAGVLEILNPAYNPDTGEFNSTLLAYDNSHETQEGDFGSLYFDINQNGVFDSAVDYVANYHLLLNKCFFSEWIREAAEGLGVSFPDHIATLSETQDFWLHRNGEKWIDSAVDMNPNLMFLVEAGDKDHVQGALDHPHVLIQYNGFLYAGARFVRLNPDRYYVEEISNATIPEAADNDGFAIFDHITIRDALQPRNIPNLRSEKSVVAAICELADRTKTNNLDPQINQQTGINTEYLESTNQLGQFFNYPNPFRSSTYFCFELNSTNEVVFDIYNKMGQQIATLINESIPPGAYELKWNALDQNGNKLPAGIYLGKLRIGSDSKIIRLLLLN